MRYMVRLTLICAIVGTLVLLGGVLIVGFDGYCTAPICGPLQDWITVR